MKEVDSIALQKSVEIVNDAYTPYYKKQNDEPRFKSKKNPTQSYTTKYVNGNIDVLDNHIKLPKLGLVRFAKSREVHGRIINATIRRNPSGKYFVSILTETEVQPLDKTGSSVGVDVGLKDFATLSDGTVYENPKFFQVVVVAKNFASSQRGSNRGHQHKDVKNLALREWTCPVCTDKHERDLNASINLRNEALRLTAGTVVIA